MAEEAAKRVQNLKRQVKRTYQRAMERSREMGYSVIDSDDKPFSFISTRSAELRFVRVVIGHPDPGIVALIKKVPCPPNCTKEIWEKENGNFLIREIT